MTQDRFDVSGRRALVTGASNGVGRAIAMALAEHGADMALHYSAAYDREREAPDSAAETAAAVTALGRRVAVIEGDLAEPGAARRIFDEAVAVLGGIDILVLNASVQSATTLLEITDAELDWQYAVNLKAGIHLLQRALPPMAERGWGRVLTLGSIQQARPMRSCIFYAATKAAQLNLVMNLAKEYAARGVTLNNLAPGLVETQRNLPKRKADPDWAAYGQSRNPTRRISTPEDYAGAALLLCSDAGSFITGANLYATGGGHLAYLPDELPPK